LINKQKTVQQIYFKDYLNTYFYQFFSIILNLSSLFIVIPFLSTNKSIFGIYSVCISINIFFSYADFGFLGAGLKYGAEYFSKGERVKEVQILGFTHFILTIFITLFSLIILLLSFYPQYIISQISSKDEFFVASNLLRILAIFSPIIIIQRCVQAIFTIRVKDYLLQKINIVSNVIKVSSVLFFFHDNNYNIINYYLFIQIVNLIFSFLSVLLAKKEFNYDFLLLIKSVRFDKELYNKTKGLALSGLVMTISWIIYYELDAFAIGKLLGPVNVAVYSIAFTILTFFRSILGIYFSPFSARFNHLIGNRQFEKLNSFFSHIIKISFPLITFPILALFFFADSIIYSWVGYDYFQSILLLKILVFCNFLGFVAYPAGILMSAREEIKKMYIIGIFTPIIYWAGIFISIEKYGMLSFAFFKLFIFIASGFYYIFYAIDYLKISFSSFVKNYIIPFLPGIILIIINSLIFKDLYLVQNNKLSLFVNLGLLAITILSSFVMSIFSSNYLRSYIQNLYKLYFK
jgi:O-antigen/teichoic acid export membrane protein